MAQPEHVARPPVRPWHAVTALDAFAIVTWSVDPGRLQAALPAALAPRTFDVAGREVGLVSAVSFLDRDFRFRLAPIVRMSCGQINHRAYVHHDGTDGVWFAGTSLDHPLVAVARHLWAMPWHRERIQVSAHWDGEDLAAMEVEATGAWGACRLSLAPPSGDAPTALQDPRVTDPLLGWYPRRDGGTGRYSVWHPPLPLRPATVVRAEARPFCALGVLDPDQPPLGALVCRTTTFDVHTPPRRVGSS